MDTLDLFKADTAARHDQAVAMAEQRQRDSWRICWDWEGPVVGGICTVNTPVVQRAAGGTIYAYMERARLLEEQPDGRWLVEISMGDVRGEPWPKDGMLLLLGILDIWPPMDRLRFPRGAA